MAPFDNERFWVKQIHAEQLQEAKDLIVNYFAPTVPAFSIFKISQELAKKRVANNVSACLESGIAIACYDQSHNKMVGVLLCKVLEPSANDHMNTSCNHSPGVQAFITFASWMERDLHKELGAKKICDQFNVVVHSDYTGKGIYKAMCLKCDQVAKELGCDYAVSLLVSLYSIKGAEKQGKSVLREINFADYVDPVTGIRPDLELSEIHNCARLVYNKLGD